MSKKKQVLKPGMPIGKHKGKAIAAILAEEPSYLAWFFDTVDGYDDVKQAIAALFVRMSSTIRCIVARMSTSRNTLRQTHRTPRLPRKDSVTLRVSSSFSLFAHSHIILNEISNSIQ